jgi:hypothetical protein
MINPTDNWLTLRSDKMTPLPLKVPIYIGHFTGQVRTARLGCVARREPGGKSILSEINCSGGVRSPYFDGADVFFRLVGSF